MPASFDYDVVILGAGPGGYVAGIRAGQLGLKAAVVERDRLGGVCLNIGCIPSKALVHQAGHFLAMGALKEMGVGFDLSGFSYRQVFAKSRKAADTLSRGVQYLLKKNKVEVVAGEGAIEDPNTVALKDGRKVRGAKLIVATGSRPKPLPGISIDEQRILSSNGALMLEELPKSVCILGGGAIGAELAHIMSAFGVEVHLVEMLGHLLPLEDEETVQVLNAAFKKRGIHVYTGTKASGVDTSGPALAVSLEGGGDGGRLNVDKLLVVAGRAPNTEGIGLERIGVRMERGFVAVGDFCQTNVPGVYAIGDITPSPMLAHVASKEAEIAVEHIAGKNPKARLDPLSIPSGVYSEPQVASFGYTEAKAKEAGLAYRKAVFPYRGAGKAVATEQAEGMVKVLFDEKTREILGAHVAGAEATELIHELLLARTAELVPEDIASMIHAHPTLSEAVMEACRAAEGWAIHI